MTQQPQLSIVIPLFNEELNVNLLFERLQNLRAKLQGTSTEIIFIDDGSQDQTYECVKALCRSNENVRLIRLSSNCGSHVAIMTGLKAAHGQATIFMAGDLQDPPELILDMLKHWQSGYKIVWAARTQIENQQAKDRMFSTLYWTIVHYVSGIKLPKTGVDFALIDQAVIEAMTQHWTFHTPIFLSIAETGFPSTVIYYQKAARHGGKSGWTLSMKLALVGRTLLYSFRPTRKFITSFYPEKEFQVEEFSAQNQDKISRV
jgi:dolichol-phosphate mannosyltransferase